MGSQWVLSDQLLRYHNQQMKRLYHQPSFHTDTSAISRKLLKNALNYLLQHEEQIQLCVLNDHPSDCECDTVMCQRKLDYWKILHENENTYDFNILESLSIVVYLLPRQGSCWLCQMTICTCWYAHVDCVKWRYAHDFNSVLASRLACQKMVKLINYGGYLTNFCRSLQERNLVI